MHVEATNNAHVFGVAGAFVAGFTGLSGGVDVGLIRNDTEAIIGKDAVVRAAGDVVVAVEAIKDVNSFVSGIGATPVVGLSLYSIRADLTVPFFDKVPIKFLNIKNASTVQDYLDQQVLEFTQDKKTSISNLLKNMEQVIGKRATDAANTIKTDAPVSKVSKAVKSHELGTGNKASINASDVRASGNVLVSAEEKLKSVLETAYIVNFGSSAGARRDQQCRPIAEPGNAVATIEGNANVRADGDIGVNAHVEDTPSSMPPTPSTKPAARPRRSSGRQGQRQGVSTSTPMPTPSRRFRR